MGRPTKEQSAAKAALAEDGVEMEPNNDVVSDLKIPLVGVWFNTAEQRFETILAKCDPATGEAKVETTKNAGVLPDQAFSHLKQLILEQRMNRGLK